MNKKLRKDMAKAMHVHADSFSGPSNALSLSPTGGIVSLAPRVSDGLTVAPSITVDSPMHTAYANSHYPDMTTSQRYSYLMSTPNDTLWAVPFFVASSDGSVYYGTSNDGIAFLTIADIQSVENPTNTAGTLLLKLNQPALAKATAGYSGANSSVTTSTPTVSDPIPEVQALPHVGYIQTTTNTGGAGSGLVNGQQVVFNDTGTTTPPADTSTSSTTPALPPATNVPTTNTAPMQSSMSSLGGKYWWLWYLLAAIAIILYMKYGRK